MIKETGGEGIDVGCLKCGDTGVCINGEVCDCGIQVSFIQPSFIQVPAQYQNNPFDARLLPQWMPSEYGVFMTKLVRDCMMSNQYLHQNILVCSPPNSGKTVMAYSVLGGLYAQGQKVFGLMDIMEVRGLLMEPYHVDREGLSLFGDAPVIFIKIPLDLPAKLAATISMVVERRVRRGGSSVFLYSGAKEDLVAQDTFGSLQALFGDGAYNSILVKSWKKKEVVHSESTGIIC